MGHTLTMPEKEVAPDNEAPKLGLEICRAQTECESGRPPGVGGSLCVGADSQFARHPFAL